MSAEINRQPPFSAEAEQALLSSMLQGGATTIEDVRGRVRSEAFYMPTHRKLFDIIVMAYEGKVPLDLVTFTQELRNAGFLDELGGAAAVTSIFNFVPSPVNVDHYVDIVREKWTAREIIAKCAEGARAAYDESQDAHAVLERLQSDVIEIGQISHTSESIRHVSEFVDEVRESIEQTYRRRGKTIGIPTGFVDLDRLTGGFQAPKTYYIGARPAMGKTSLGTEFLEHVAIECAEKKYPALFFSVEMTAQEITEVILCRRSSINLVKLRDGFFSDAERHRLDEECAVLKQAPIYVDDTAGLSILEMRARSRRAVTKLGVKLIAIDYVQRMKSTSKRAQGNREQEINEIAQGISETAKELKVPIIVLAQLNRKIEERADKTPELSDFRESGSLEQEAHFVGLLHRPSYYCKSEAKLALEAEKQEMTVEAFQELTELIVAKQRRGPVAKERPLRLRFIKQYAQFQSEDEERPLYSNRPEDRQGKTKPTERSVDDVNDELNDL